MSEVLRSIAGQGRRVDFRKRPLSRTPPAVSNIVIFTRKNRLRYKREHALQNVATIGNMISENTFSQKDMHFRSETFTYADCIWMAVDPESNRCGPNRVAPRPTAREKRGGCRPAAGFLLIKYFCGMGISPH